MADEVDAKTGKKKSRAIVVLMRGDHQLNEAKFNGTVGDGDASDGGRRDQGAVQVSGGISGAGRDRVGAGSEESGDKPVLLVDKALEGRTNLIAGANKEDYHLKNLTPGKDFHPTAYADLRA